MGYRNGKRLDVANVNHHVVTSAAKPTPQKAKPAKKAAEKSESNDDDAPAAKATDSKE